MKNAKFSTFRKYKHWLLAVSGGPDSLALLSLALDWRKKHALDDLQISVVTVDHGFRVESADEASYVARICDDFNVPHTTLCLEGNIPTSNIQAVAREGRYKLICCYAKSINADIVLLGHHADDQVETFILRLARGSSVDGLSSMRPEIYMNDVLFGRPFLDVSKSELITHLKNRKLDWISDSSNDNLKFDRVRVRQSMSILNDIGLTRERLLQTVKQMRRASDALGQIASDVMRKNILWCNSLGAVVFAPVHFTTIMPETRMRILRCIIVGVRPTLHPPCLTKIEKLDSAIISLNKNGDELLRRTLQGVIFDGNANGMMVYAEEGRNKFPIIFVNKSNFCWDERCNIEIKNDKWGMRDRLLTVRSAGLNNVPKTLNFPSDITIPIPKSTLRHAIANAPHLFRDDKIIAGPSIDVGSKNWKVNHCDSCFFVKMVGENNFYHEPIE